MQLPDIWAVGAAIATQSLRTLSGAGCRITARLKGANRAAHGRLRPRGSYRVAEGQHPGGGEDESMQKKG